MGIYINKKNTNGIIVAAVKTNICGELAAANAYK